MSETLVIHGWPQGEPGDLARFTPCGVDAHTMPEHHRVTFLRHEVTCNGCLADRWGATP